MRKRYKIYKRSHEGLIVEADAVITDPPYGIGYCSGANSSRSISSTGKRFTQKVRGDGQDFNPEYWVNNYDQVAFTGPQFFYSRLPEGGMFHCWDKRGNYKPLDQADADLVWVKEPRKPYRRSRVFHLVWRGICRHAENRDRIYHPTQKPVALMEWIINLCQLEPNSLIYDPFMGSGTTGVAAINLGHRFIGVEIELEFYKVARRRIAEALYRSETEDV